jgi:site-specific recombinase XerD
MTILTSDCFEKFITSKTADGRAPRTLSEYRRLVTPFVWLYPVPAQITRDAVRTWVVGERTCGHSESTAGITIRYLRCFLHWLYNEGYTDDDLSRAIVAPKKAIRDEALLSPEEFQRLVAACDGPMALRDKALLLFLVDTGVRRGELILIQRTQVNFEGGGAWLLIYAPKTDRKRYALIGVTATSALRAYLATRADSEPALWIQDDGTPFSYSTISPLLRRRAAHAGLDLKRCHPHAFRKLFATWWVQNGGDEQRLMTLGGWAGPEMLRIYVQLGNRSALQQAHTQYSPADRAMEKK